MYEAALPARVEILQGVIIMGKRGNGFPPTEFLLRRSSRQATLSGRWENPIYFYSFFFLKKKSRNEEYE